MTCVAGSASTAAHRASTSASRQDDGQQARLGRVVAEDVGEPGADDRPEPAVQQRPDGVLAGGAGPKSGPATRIEASAYCGWLSTKSGSSAPPGDEQPVLEAGAGDPLEVLGRDDLVGVDVAAAQRDGGAGVRGEGVHRGQAPAFVRSAGAVSLPVRAVAAATAGDTRWVRPPLPCRPGSCGCCVEADALPRLQLVGVHAQAHRAAGAAPLGARVEEHPVEALGLGLRLHRHRPGDDEHPRVWRRRACPRSSVGGDPEVLDPAVGAGAEEDRVDLMSRSGVPAVRPM